MVKVLEFGKENYGKGLLLFIVMLLFLGYAPNIGEFLKAAFSEETIKKEVETSISCEQEKKSLEKKLEDKKVDITRLEKEKEENRDDLTASEFKINELEIKNSELESSLISEKSIINTSNNKELLSGQKTIYSHFKYLNEKNGKKACELTHPDSDVFCDPSSEGAIESILRESEDMINGYENIRVFPPIKEDSGDNVLCVEYSNKYQSGDVWYMYHYRMKDGLISMKICEKKETRDGRNIKYKNNNCDLEENVILCY